MEIYQLRAFVTVARLGHLTRAAEALHLTQPAVSGQVKALEEALGLALFDRRPGRIELTRTGERLLPLAESVLVAAAGLTGKAAELRHEVSGHLTLGVVGDADSLRLGSLLAALVQALPLLHIHTRTGHAEELLEAVTAGTLPVAFYIGPGLPHHVPALPLQTLQHRIVAPPALRDAVLHAGWRELADLPWIAPPPGSHTQLLLRDAFSRQGLVPNIVLRADGEAPPLPLVRSGVGLALVREDLALHAAQQDEVVVWPHARLAGLLCFIHARTAAAEPGVIATLSQVRQVWDLPAH
jgi:DNA-binding transcriptional LysR family regulator